MLSIIPKERESIDQILKRYKNKVKTVGLIKEVKKRVEYKKPSEKRREQRLKAIYTQRYRTLNQ